MVYCNSFDAQLVLRVHKLNSSATKKMGQLYMFCVIVELLYCYTFTLTLVTRVLF